MTYYLISSLTVCFIVRKRCLEATEKEYDHLNIWYMYIEVACSEEIYYFCHVAKVLVKVSPDHICIFAWTWTSSSDHIHSYANDFALLVFGGKTLDIRFSRIKDRWMVIPVYICTTVILPVYGFLTHQLPIKSIHLIISIYQYCMFTKIIHYRYILINNVF